MKNASLAFVRYAATTANPESDAVTAVTIGKTLTLLASPLPNDASDTDPTCWVLVAATICSDITVPVQFGSQLKD